MRTWLKIWALPITLLVAWFVLSYNDWNFGTHMFSRDAFDQFLNIYAVTLGVEVNELPALLGKALLFDSWLIVAFIAYRKRNLWMPPLQSYIAPFVQRFAR